MRILYAYDAEYPEYVCISNLSLVVMNRHLGLDRLDLLDAHHLRRRLHLHDLLGLYLLRLVHEKAWLMVNNRYRLLVADHRLLLYHR
jgi:hypothetical protein